MHANVQQWAERLLAAEAAREPIAPLREEIGADADGAIAYANQQANTAHAVAQGSRVILLITGRPPRDGGRRGVIHASFREWLAASRHARRIAAIRPAHLRHGGSGAFYVVLRRSRAKS